ncbi:MAG: FtsW/RodA/SpoVE family cell cycle protein [Prevotellaceae bacterium]|jgi:cell division protein FtsW|nr:FtsW/RodA/SpoVE family cell cycle protein [Prevotellaceae bacterium]
MIPLLKKYLKGDPILWFVFIALCVVSAVEMYSATSTLAYKAANHTAPMLHHVGFLALGALMAFLIHFIPYKYIRILAYLGLIISVVLLILVLFMGESENDATRWLQIFGIRFQPSEIAKISVVIVTADMISRIRKEADNEKTYFRNIILIVGIICLPIFPENFSTVCLILAVVLCMMYIGQVSWKRLLTLVGSLAVVAVMGYFIVKNTPRENMPEVFDRSYTWIERIDRFLYEEEDPATKYVINDKNRQVQHGRIAIARGGIFGVFPGNSIQRDYLPQAYADFIFAIIVEEMGLVGGIFVILLYLVLLFRVGRIATKSKTPFTALLVIGLALTIVLQALMSTSVAASLAPVTGQPLPLISRGGTSILVTCIYFGIILGVTRQMRDEEEAEKIGEMAVEDAEDSDDKQLSTVGIDDI